MPKAFGISFAVGASLSPTVANVFSTVEQKIRASASRISQLTARSKAYEAAAAARAEMLATQRAFAAGGGKDALLGRTLQTQTAAYQKAKKAADAYGVAVTDYAKAHARAERALAGTQARLEALNRAQAFKAKRQETAGNIQAALVPAAMLAMPIKQAIDFESAMADAAKTIDGMRDDSGKLTGKYYEMETAIKQLGRTLPLTHEQLASMFAAAGQQGMTNVRDLQEFTEMAAHMSVAFGVTTEEAADAIGGYRSALGLTMPQARELLDLMNYYANTTTASEKGIADIVRRVGALGQVGGVAAKPMAALASVLDGMKVSPEIAATGLKNLVLGLTAGDAASKKARTAFATLGIDTTKLAKHMQVDAEGAILSVLEALQKLPKAQQLSTLQEIFGRESLGAIAPLLNRLDIVRQRLTMVGDTSKYSAAMQQEFANRSDTTANKLRLAQNRAKEMGITLAAGLLPAIQGVLEVAGPIVSSVADFAGKHQTLSTVLIGTATGFMALRVVGMGASWMFSYVAGGAHLLRATCALLVPGLFRTAAAEGAVTTATNAGRAAAVRQGAALVASRAAALGAAAASKVAAVGQWALNAALSANPVGIVVMAVGALAAGMVYLYKTCEPVRAAFDAVFGWIGGKIGWAWEKLKAVGRFFGVGGDEEPDGEAAGALADAATAKAFSAGPAAALPPIPEMPEIPESAGPALAQRSGAPAQGAPTVQVNMQFQLNGMPDQDFAQGVIRALRERSGELERIISGIVHNQARLAYGG